MSLSLHNNILLISYLEGEIPNHGYKHLIRSGISGYNAFKTDAGLKLWFERTQAKVLEERVSEVNVDEQRLVIKYTFFDGLTIKEHLFWSLQDVPKGAEAYTGLSNGSLVTCYFENKGGVHHIYRPNPNAKEVYMPLPLEEHIKYMQQFG